MLFKPGSSCFQQVARPRIWGRGGARQVAVNGLRGRVRSGKGIGERDRDG